MNRETSKAKCHNRIVDNGDAINSDPCPQCHPVAYARRAAKHRKETPNKPLTASDAKG